MADSTGADRNQTGRALVTAALAAVFLIGLTAVQPAEAGAGDPAKTDSIAQPYPKREWRSDGGTRKDGAPPVRGTECVGTDLVQALKLNDPGSFDQFETTARGVLNGQGLLWRVESPEGKVSYLFGTMHSSEAAAKAFDELVLRALGKSRVVATELPGASTRKVAAELRRLVSNRSFRPQGEALGPLPSDLRAQVELRIAQTGIPPQVAEQLQPWYLALVLSRSNCMSQGVGADTETADARIERLALEQGSNLVALESPVEQVDALASIPDDVALRMVRDATEKNLKPEDVESTITGLYSSRRIGYLLAMRGPAWAAVFDVDGYADFITAFITRRNATMLQRALPILTAGQAFLAVGALHLPGEAGLVELIRRAGFSVTRIW